MENLDIFKIIKTILPYVISVITAWLSYKEATKKTKLELDKIEKDHKNDLEKLIKQHEIDIENLKEKHNLEMESKDKDYKHEIEMQKLKSQTSIDEKTKELEGNALYGVMGDVFKGIFSGEITKEQLENLQKQFPSQ